MSYGHKFEFDGKRCWARVDEGAREMELTFRKVAGEPFSIRDFEPEETVKFVESVRPMWITTWFTEEWLLHGVEFTSIGQDKNSFIVKLTYRDKKREPLSP
jgi:hypothetical protein